MTSNTVIMIPARGGSKRIHNKNITLLGDKPLIAYSILSGKKLNLPIYVSTESLEITKTSLELGAKVINRPIEYAADSSLDIEWVIHALNIIKQTEGYMPLKIILLRATTPFRDLSVLETGISSFKDTSDSLRSIEPISEALEKHFRIEDDYLKSPFPMELKTANLPNQTFPAAYKANGYIDILKSEYVLKHLDIYGEKIQGFITPHTIEIDTLEELEYAQFLGKKHGYFKNS